MGTATRKDLSGTTKVRNCEGIINFVTSAPADVGEGITSETKHPTSRITADTVPPVITRRR